MRESTFNQLLSSKHQRGLAIALLSSVSLIALIWNLGAIGLVDKTEPMFVEAARQMVVTNDWITPHWNGETRFDKPPLSYWGMAIAFKLFGLQEWAARLPSALSAIATVGLVYYVLRKFGRSEDKSGLTAEFPALLGGSILALTPFWFIWGRTGVSDMLLASNMSLSLLSFFVGYVTGGLDWYFAFYVFMGLAVLAKGPVAIVLPALIILGFLFYVGQLKKTLLEMRLIRGAIVLFTMIAPWFILVTLANGQDYIDSFFVYHNVARFTRVVSAHPGPIYFYLPYLFLGSLPWSAYLPNAIARLNLRARSVWQRQPRSQQLGLFAFIWLAVIFIFFSVAATKLPSYILPLMPAVAILVTLYWQEKFTADSSSQSWGFKLSALVNGLFFVAIGGAAFWYLSDLIQTQFPIPVLIPAGLPIRGLIVGVFSAIAIEGLLLLRRGRWIWLVNGIGMILIMTTTLLPALPIADAKLQLPLRQIATTALQAQQPREPIVMIGFMKPSLVFYTQQRIEFLRKAETSLPGLQRMAIAHPELRSFLVAIYSEDLPDLKLKPTDYQILRHVEAYDLIRIPKSIVMSKPMKN